VVLDLVERGAFMMPDGARWIYTFLAVVGLRIVSYPVFFSFFKKKRN